MGNFQSLRLWQLVMLAISVVMVGVGIVLYYDQKPRFTITDKKIDIAKGPKETQVQLPDRIEGQYRMQFISKYEIQGVVLETQFSPETSFALIAANITWGDLPVSKEQRNALFREEKQELRTPAESRAFIGLRLTTDNLNLKQALREFEVGDAIRVKGKKITISKNDGGLIRSEEKGSIKILFLWVDELQVNNKMFN